MRHRFLAVFVPLAVSLGAGCAPAPEPSLSPRPPAFASEDEALTAAEATYRAYIEALNDVDLADPATFEPVHSWLTGEARNTSRKTLSQMHADRWQMSGHTAFNNMTLAGMDQTDGTTVLDVELCLDVTDVHVSDAAGVSLISESRPDHQALSITMTQAGTPTGLVIMTSVPAASERCG